MSTIPTMISVGEYLGSTYHPDRDYIDGELLERNAGETLHGKLQILLGWLFLNQQANWRVTPSPEQRVQISSSRYRVPDVCVISDEAHRDLRSGTVTKAVSGTSFRVAGGLVAGFRQWGAKWAD
jgi:Uma2 family endonuclease